MILSFHPLLIGDENINCAGRPPGPTEKEAAARAEAIFVPQGVRRDLYLLCRSRTDLVWPNYDHRFDHPGKVGQSLWFAQLDLPRPRTVVFPSTKDFQKGGALFRPYLLKANFGGEGRGVFPVLKKNQAKKALSYLAQNEPLGRGGFIQQELIDHGGRDLRAVLIGKTILAYWRTSSDPDSVLTNVSQGGVPDFDSDPELIKRGVETVRRMAETTGLNLAGFDLLFDRSAPDPEPLFIEINYFFGRSALGGSEKYYKLLKKAADDWLRSHGLKRSRVRSRPRYSDRD